MGIVDRLRSKFCEPRSRGYRVGMFVDGPNVFRDEFDVDLNELRQIARLYTLPPDDRPDNVHFPLRSE